MRGALLLLVLLRLPLLLMILLVSLFIIRLLPLLSILLPLTGAVVAQASLAAVLTRLMLLWLLKILWLRIVADVVVAVAVQTSPTAILLVAVRLPYVLLLLFSIAILWLPFFRHFNVVDCIVDSVSL